MKHSRTAANKTRKCTRRKRTLITVLKHEPKMAWHARKCVIYVCLTRVGIIMLWLISIPKTLTFWHYYTLSTNDGKLFTESGCCSFSAQSRGSNMLLLCLYTDNNLDNQCALELFELLCTLKTVKSELCNLDRRNWSASLKNLPLRTSHRHECCLWSNNWVY